MDELIADLRSDEGFKPFPYQDTRNLPTIGYGFLLDPERSEGLPRPVAEFWLRYVVNASLAEFRNRWAPFDSQPPDVQRALGNMIHQMGVNGVLGFKDMLDALEAGDRTQAALEAMSSKWATQTPNRARRVASLIRGA